MVGLGCLYGKSFTCPEKLYVAERGLRGRTDVDLFDLTELHHKTVFMH